MRINKALPIYTGPFFQKNYATPYLAWSVKYKALGTYFVCENTLISLHVRSEMGVVNYDVKTYPSRSTILV